MIKRAFLLLCGLACYLAAANAQSSNTYEKWWGIQVGVGSFNVIDDSPDGQPNYFSDDQTNDFYLSIDRYMGNHWALTGGLYFSQVGLWTDASDNIGVKKISNAGVTAGVKYYLLQPKWIIQPFVGASAKLNVLNLGGKIGEIDNIQYQGNPYRLQYDIKSPALSLLPRVGVDIRLISSLSLCIDYQGSYGFGGHNKQTVYNRYTGELSERKMDRWQSGASIALKMDVPLRVITEKSLNGTLFNLWNWFSSK